MTRQRKEIYKKMDQAYQQYEAEMEMGCGFGADHIYKAYDSMMDDLYTDLALTYGMSLEEYNDYVSRFLNYGYSDYVPSYEECTSCSTCRDYSPSNPWDAPGMSIRDFI